MAKQTALITGASAGLGREYARLFAKDGHDLVLVARRRERLDELASELTAAYKTACLVVTADLAAAGAGQRIADHVRAAGRTIDFLVNNAGFGRRGAFAQSDRRGQLEMIDVNVRALVELTHLFLPGMLERKSGTHPQHRLDSGVRPRTVHGNLLRQQGFRGQLHRGAGERA